MKRRAVKRRPRPGYPTRREVRLDPRLLAENLPSAWRGNARLVQAAAALLALQAAGCGVEREPGGEPERSAVVGEAPDARSAAPVTAARVAPVFLHGDGRGATGCVVMNPPLFLSEEEALQIIVEELGRHGVEFAERNVVVDPVSITRRRQIVVWKPDGISESRVIDEEGNPTTLAVDLADRKRRVAVEFICADDFGAMGGASGRGTVRDYDFPEALRRVRAEIQRQGREPWHYGLFYDPLAAGRANSQDLLRAQVRDFAEWLKREGVI
jgi:hypothetical protein